MPTIYVLLCEKGRYYIGKTNRPLQERIEEHFDMYGSEWTSKYKPVKVVEQIDNADEFDEDKFTKIYMKKYGIDKVRGGTYTQMELPKYSLLTLEKELCNADNLCFRCNRSGHFADTCYASTKADGTPIDDDDSDDSEDDVWCCEYCEKEFVSENEVLQHEKRCKYNYRNKRVCYRCGRPGHYTNECYANYHIDGMRLDRR